MKVTDISLRDWFAGQALSAMELKQGYLDLAHINNIVKQAYLIADTMIEESFRPLD